MTYQYAIQRRNEWDMSNTNGSSGLTGMANQIFVTTISTVIATIIVGFLGFLIGLFSLPEDLSDFEESVEEQFATLNMSVDTKMEALETKIESKLEAHDARISTLENPGSYNIEVNPDINVNPYIVFPSNTLELGQSGGSGKYVMYYLGGPYWKKSEDTVGIEKESGEEIKAGDLVNEKILMPYKEDGKEIFFYGQFNENNHWDGNCVVNVYQNDTLILIMEADYNDGVLSNYKQAIPYRTQGSVDVWIISEREHVDNLNSGDSWSYVRENNYLKDFVFDEVDEKKILDIEAFESTIDLKLEAFYHGNTSEGFYNDDTGEAYLVKYADDGTVRTLYKGKFVNGDFVDDTGTAWYITKDEKTDYMYYRGTFIGGHPANEEGDTFENPVSQERIDEIIGDMTFDCELNWFAS